MKYCVYILTNKTHTVLYIGVTSNLVRRVYEHKQHLVKGFTKRYSVDRLVYFEQFGDPESAIRREKQLEAGSRQRKLDLIATMNPKWENLYQTIL